MISFFVHGIPKAQPRARRSKHGGVYTPDTAAAWKEAIVLQGRRYRPSSPIKEPLEVCLDFFLPRPKALERAKDPAGPIWAPVKPDRDNLEKAVLDALTADQWWIDDSQVCTGATRKFYRSKAGLPGVRITITGLTSSGPKYP